MMVSIDGKIEGYFADAPLTGACGDYYEEVIPKLGDAHGTGSYTACLYMAQADVDYDAFKDTPVEDGDFIVKNESISLFSTVMASATGMMHSPAECRSWKF